MTTNDNQARIVRVADRCQEGIRMSRIANPVLIAKKLNNDEVVKTIPVFTHKIGNVVFESPVVIRCAQSGMYNVVARVNEEGVYEKDNTFVGNDKTSKTGFYRIDKATDKDNQTTWRAKRAALIAQAEAIVESDNKAA
jgi:hypothetical protein